MTKNNLILILLAVIVGLAVYVYFASGGESNKEELDKLEQQLKQKDDVISKYDIENLKLHKEIEVLQDKDSIYQQYIKSQDEKIRKIQIYYDRKIAEFDSTTSIVELEQFFSTRYGIR